MEGLLESIVQYTSGRLAQLVRAPALQAGGRRFESCTAHHIFNNLENSLRLQFGPLLPCCYPACCAETGSPWTTSRRQIALQAGWETAFPGGKYATLAPSPPGEETTMLSGGHV